MLENTFENSLDSKKIKPVNPKRSKSWIFIGRTDAEAEPSILWPLVVKSWFIGKDPDSGKDLMQEEKGTTEDEMGGWHHWFNGHKLGKTLGDGEDSMAWHATVHGGHKKSDTTWQLNNNNDNFLFSSLISSVIYWIFRSILFNLCVFVFCFLQFFVSHNWYLVSQSCQKRCLTNFNFIKFTKAWFLTQDVIYLGECSLCSWEGSVVFYIWVKCPRDTN